MALWMRVPVADRVDLNSDPWLGMAAGACNQITGVGEERRIMGTCYFKFSGRTCLKSKVEGRQDRLVGKSAYLA